MAIASNSSLQEISPCSYNFIYVLTIVIWASPQEVILHKCSPKLICFVLKLDNNMPETLAEFSHMWV